MIHARLFVLIAGLLTGASASAQIERQHDAHVHGQATGTLAVEAGRVELELSLPGVNLVGFEHPPRDDAQTEAIEAALVRLAEGEWLIADPRAGCRVEGLDAHTRGFGHDNAHAQGHEHDHEHEHSEYGHAEFRVRAELDCASGNPAWLELHLFAPWPGNERVVLDVLTETRASRVRLDAARLRIEIDH